MTQNPTLSAGVTYRRPLVARILRWLLPLLVLVGAVLGARAVMRASPQAERRAEPQSILSVEATRLMPVDYPVVIRSQGTVEPTLKSTLVPEVTGRVTVLHPGFVVGGRFADGEILARIDERDYGIALTGALASLAQSDAALKEQEALADQARADWKALGRRGTPSGLTLREPQLAAARANLDAAKAEVERAELDLERTRLIAPYDGRVLERDVELGRFVSRGTPIGVVHSIESAEVRLPITARQLEFLRLPGDAERSPERLPNVEIVARAGNGTDALTGKLVRVEGVDAATRQLYVIARFEAAFADSATALLRVGEFVNVRIAGRVLRDVFVVPRVALREDREVLVLDAEGRISRRAVDVAWTDEQVAVVREGLATDELLVTTPLNVVADGTPVRATIDGVPPESSRESPVGLREAGERNGGDARAGDASASGSPAVASLPAQPRPADPPSGGAPLAPGS